MIQTVLHYLWISIYFLYFALLSFLIRRYRKKQHRPLFRSEKGKIVLSVVFLTAALLVHCLDGIFGSVLRDFLPSYGILLLAIVTFAELGLWFSLFKQKGSGFSKSNWIGAGMILMIFVGIGVSSAMSSLPAQYPWYLDAMRFAELDSLMIDGSSQKIALIDSGISEIQRKVQEDAVSIEEVSLVDDGKGVRDQNGHGSQMFYILKFSVTSLTDYLSIRVMDDTGAVSEEALAEAIELAIEKDCTVINLSLGSYEESAAVTAAIQKALDKNITVVAQAGDDGASDLMFPANLDGVISVGALAESGAVWDGTNDPDDCTILAPGENIETFRFGKSSPFDTEETSGTSQATALISGYVALLRDYAVKNNVDLDNAEIISLLEKVNGNELSYCDALSNLA